ncbi:MAG: hypothetical protein NW224_23145 [Leptolyngbyaceae cyanobacterium bins.302]|nr:hypothetical protein [Leptolyngbyaceae cyanobacterium bins.302]
MNQISRALWASFAGTVAAIVALEGGNPTQALDAQASPEMNQQSDLPLTLANNQATSALASHLKKVGAKMYGAYWCPHCTRQKEMFGSAFQGIDYVECDPRGANPRPNLCKEAGIKGYPTWEINGKVLVGVPGQTHLIEQGLSPNNHCPSQL